jgi:hypothetical protein
LRQPDRNKSRFHEQRYSAAEEGHGSVPAMIDFANYVDELEKLASSVIELSDSQAIHRLDP